MKTFSYLFIITLFTTASIASYNPTIPQTPPSSPTVHCPDITQQIVIRTPGMNQQLPNNGRIQTGSIALRQQRGYPINPPLGQTIQVSNGQYQIVNFMVYNNDTSLQQNNLQSIMTNKNQQKLEFWKIMDDWDLDGKLVCVYKDWSGNQGYFISLLTLP